MRCGIVPVRVGFPPEGKFDRVSTKYLINYINWFLYLEKKASNTVSFIKNFILEILMDYNARGLYRQFKANRVLVRQLFINTFSKHSYKI